LRLSIFWDGHMHVDQQHVDGRGIYPGRFAQRDYHFIDPHEIANVMGMQGVQLMHAEGRQMPTGA